MSEHPQIELTTRPSRTQRLQQRVMLLFLGVFALGVLFLVDDRRVMPWDWPWLEIFSSIAERPYRLGYVIFAVVIGWGAVLATRRHLVFDKDGLRSSTRVPGLLKLAQQDWSCRWDEIDGIDRVGATFEVVVRADGKTHRLPMLGWRRVETETEPAVQSFREIFRLERSDWKLKSQAQVAQERIAGSELLEALAAYGVEVRERPDTVETLLKSRTGLSLAVIAIVAMFYTLAEMVFGEEAYAGGAPLMLILSVATCAGIAGYVATDSLRMKASGKIGFAILLAAVLGGASYPGIIRLNILFDIDGAVSVNYRQDANLRLLPENDVFPPLQIERYDWYWRRFNDGHVHEILMRRGGLGIWTYNAAELRKQIRERDERGQ